MALGDKLGRSGTPAFVIGDEVVPSAVGPTRCAKRFPACVSAARRRVNGPQSLRTTLCIGRALLFSFEAMHEPSAPPRDLPQKDNDETVRIVRAFAETAASADIV
jgi:hypothetical protein